MPRPGVPDIYRTRARAAGYASRAVYKLKEIDERYRLFLPGQRVLDLGCCPGSWMQYLAARVGPQGLVLGVDLQPLAIALSPPLSFLQGEVESLDLARVRAISPEFDAVVSDLAPRTTGVKEVDQQRSLALALKAWDLARELLRAGGHFLVKVFAGPDLGVLTGALEKSFHTVRLVKPRGSRAASKEIYLLGLKRRAAGRGQPGSAR